MISPIFNLGVSARTNRVLWKYASHQFSQAAVWRIDCLIPDWTRNGALARPAVPLQKRTVLRRGKTSQPTSVLCLQQSIHRFLPLKVMFSLVIVYCSKDSPQTEVPIFGHASGGRGSLYGWPFSLRCRGWGIMEDTAVGQTACTTAELWAWKSFFFF